MLVVEVVGGVAVVLEAAGVLAVAVEPEVEVAEVDGVLALFDKV